MWRFLKMAGLILLGYIGHLFIETFIFTNVLGYFGLSIPVMV